MKEYRCLKCCFSFVSENEIPYCPACDCEDLEEVEEDVKKIMQMESHHIHPRFMDNKKGEGQQFLINKETHNILHGKIMNWIWKEIPEDNKKDVIKNIINNSKKFIGVNNE